MKTKQIEKFKITGRTKINRMPVRGYHDRETIYKILDESFICQIGFNIDGQVNIIPTLYGRKDDSIFIHGSKNSRMLKSFETGEDICISVTLIDGIVLARSAFHHSVNYRSVVLFGNPIIVKSEEKKKEALNIIMDQIISGRWEDVRKPNEKELNVTSIYKIKINEASAKIRTGPAVDDKDDLDLNVWAGVLPLKTIADEPMRNPDLKENIGLPDYLHNYNMKIRK